ncbi:hypothetical protein [Mycobacterium sp.]|uniref:hypothetical protein n=1 Tax=Mycobacterium sp. TaxID=1785 RepID=UPI003C729CA3
MNWSSVRYSASGAGASLLAQGPDVIAADGRVNCFERVAKTDRATTNATAGMTDIP